MFLAETASHVLATVVSSTLRSFRHSSGLGQPRLRQSRFFPREREKKHPKSKRNSLEAKRSKKTFCFSTMIYKILHSSRYIPYITKVTVLQPGFFKKNPQTKYAKRSSLDSKTELDPMEDRFGGLKKMFYYNFSIATD